MAKAFIPASMKYNTSVYQTLSISFLDKQVLSSTLKQLNKEHLWNAYFNPIAVFCKLLEAHILLKAYSNKQISDINEEYIARLQP